MSRQGHIAKQCVRRCKKGGRKRSSRCTRWYYVLDAPPGPDGKRKQTWSKGYTTRKAAEVAVREELSRRDQGIVLSTERLTVREFMDPWVRALGLGDAFSLVDGGKDGIRTHGSLATSTVFEMFARDPSMSWLVRIHPP